MHVGIVLLGRFPTQKAYGVTTIRTIEELRELDYKVTVFAIDSNERFDEQISFELFHYRENVYSKALKRIAFAGFSTHHIAAWRLYLHLIRVRNQKNISSQNIGIFWLRDPDSIKFVPKSKKLVLELHQKTDSQGLSGAVRAKKVSGYVVAPISKEILRNCNPEDLDAPIIYSPLGIRKEDIASEIDVMNFLKQIKIKSKEGNHQLRVGYVGKFFPNGYSKGIEDLVELACLNKKRGLNFEVSISGGTQKDISLLRRLRLSLDLSDDDLVINPHMPHDEAMRKMRTLDVIVLPEPRSQKYNGFPLKSIEAISAGRIVIAAKCQIYQDIFDAKYEPFWYESGNANSMISTIYRAISDDGLKDNLMRGLTFAHGFSWQERTRRLMNTLESTEIL